MSQVVIVFQQTLAVLACLHLSLSAVEAGPVTWAGPAMWAGLIMWAGPVKEVGPTMEVWPVMGVLTATGGGQVTWVGQVEAWPLRETSSYCPMECPSTSKVSGGHFRWSSSVEELEEIKYSYVYCYAVYHLCCVSPVLFVTYPVCNLCYLSPVLYVNCAVCHLCCMSPVLCVTCPVCHLCCMSPVLFVTCAVCHLCCLSTVRYVICAVCQYVTCVFCHLCCLSPVRVCHLCCMSVCHLSFVSPVLYVTCAVCHPSCMSPVMFVSHAVDHLLLSVICPVCLGGTDTDVDLPQPPGGKRRRRSSSTESLLVGRQLTPTSSVRPAHLPPSNPTQSIAPLKVGLSKGQLVKGVPTQTQKVIIVSGSVTGAPTMLPKTYMGAKSVVTATSSATSLISHVKAATPGGSGGVMAAGKNITTPGRWQHWWETAMGVIVKLLLLCSFTIVHMLIPLICFHVKCLICSMRIYLLQWKKTFPFVLV